MPQGSPRVNNEKYDDFDDDESESEYDNSRHNSKLRSSRHHDTSFGTPGRGTDNDSFMSSTSNSSYSFSTERMYPNLSSEIDQSGDYSYSPKSKKEKRLYPDLDQRSSRDLRSTSRKRNTSLLHESVSMREDESETRNKTSSKTENKSLTFLLLVIIVIGAVVYVVTNSSSSVNTKTETRKSGFDAFQDELKLLQTLFPNQKPRFWVTISASARHVFFPREPCYPSVILIASNAKHKDLTSCIAKKIAKAFANSQGLESHSTSLDSDVEDIKHYEASKQKEELDEKLNLAFTKAGKKSVVISNVHALAPQAALLLHGLCDGDNAPFQDVMIILTFAVEDSVKFTSEKQVEPHLTKVWEVGLHNDKLSAIMSRIANNPVYIKAEDDSVLQKMCS